MSDCSLDSGKDVPVLNVRMVGRGEDAMRMDKRLKCAGRALGIRVRIDWQSDSYGEPLVTIGNNVLIDHLVETSELESLLKPYLGQLIKID